MYAENVRKKISVEVSLQLMQNYLDKICTVVPTRQEYNIPKDIWQKEIWQHDDSQLLETNILVNTLN